MKKFIYLILILFALAVSACDKKTEDIKLDPITEQETETKNEVTEDKTTEEVTENVPTEDKTTEEKTEEQHTHAFSGEWKFDSENHWHECDCGEISGAEEHKGGEATTTLKAVCSVCGQSYGSLKEPEDKPSENIPSDVVEIIKNGDSFELELEASQDINLKEYFKYEGSKFTYEVTTEGLGVVETELVNHT